MTRIYMPTSQSDGMSFVLLILTWLSTECDVALARLQTLRVPDEQRLYRRLMADYESSVRPIFNASEKVVVHFRLSLNQIVDLDERKQVLTTSVFIDQEWADDNLKWRVEDYNGIKTIRVPARLIWLPDTFIFNNADEGSTGFMDGVYVVLQSNGTVLWPVPVKLKSSCHVDITYFPFDEQRCILRFGSWTYSGEWLDFVSSLESFILDHYVDNSEWELMAIQYEKSVRRYSCCPSPHPDLTYTLHMRRRTFYYIFNIIVPCIMLSVLTLLTFWLPTTSGEKISLGLSVFLAFSMFMLLIAEEVPATSKSVPLIGVYLTTVMTMTSVSVIMSVMVISLYNRGYRTQSAPSWLKTLVLNWLCKLLGMRHDIQKLARAVRLEEDEEAKYMCDAHVENGAPPGRRAARSPRSKRLQSPECRQVAPPCSEWPGTGSTEPCLDEDNDEQCFDTPSSVKRLLAHECRPNTAARYPDVVTSRRRKRERSPQGDAPSRRSVTSSSAAAGSYDVDVDADEDEPVWLRRESWVKGQRKRLQTQRREAGVVGAVDTDDQSERSKTSRDKTADQLSAAKEATSSLGRTVRNPPNTDFVENVNFKTSTRTRNEKTPCNKHVALVSRREIVVEWQTMAMVIDRLLFWIFLFATLIAYIIILFIIPYSKPNTEDDVLPRRVLKDSTY